MRNFAEKLRQVYRICEVKKACGASSSAQICEISGKYFNVNPEYSFLQVPVFYQLL